MSRGTACVILVLCGILTVAGTAAAQNVVISNVRIIVGNGQVIESGAIVVRDGKIASVSAGAPPAATGGQQIDGKGYTAIAGFIDGHRHLIQGQVNQFFQGPAADRMR